MSEKLFRQQALEQQKDKLYGEVVITQPVSFFWLTLGLFITITFIVLLLVYGTYARRETVMGYIVPDKGLVKIYAPVQGALSSLYINEGQLVKKGDLLFSVITANSTKNGIDNDTSLLIQLDKQKTNLLHKVEQEKELNTSRIKNIKGQINGLETEVKQLESQIFLQREQVKISSQNYINLNKLFKKGHISKSKLAEGEQSKLDAEVKFKTAKRQSLQLKNKLRELSHQQSQLPLEWTSRKSDLMRMVSDIEQKTVEISGRREYAIRAPIDGRLTVLQITLGQTVNTRSPLVAILPENSKLHAELFLPTRAAGFVALGQQVNLRYSAFPYQHYGLYQGKISDIAKIILTPTELPVPMVLKEPVYRVKVSLNEQQVVAFGKKFPLQAGMLLDADIVLEKRSLGEWLLEPVYGLRGKL